MRIRPALLLLLAPALLAQQPLSLAQVLARHFEAQGGLARLRMLHSRRLEGSIESEGSVIRFTQLNARPGCVRLDFRDGDRAWSKACDGVLGWKTGSGRKAIPLSAAEVAELDADFDGPLLDAGAKGNKVEYLGLQPFKGGQAHVLRVTLKNGRAQTHYLDPGSYLEVAHVNAAGPEMDFSDFREVDGLKLAFLVRVGATRIHLLQAAFNVPARDADFQAPAAR